MKRRPVAAVWSVSTVIGLATLHPIPCLIASVSMLVLLCI